MKREEFDIIFVKDLILPFTIGVSEEEHTRKTDICINIQAWADIQKAGKTHDLSDTVDYRYFHKAIVEWSNTKEYILVESLAQDIADHCLSHELIKKVQVRVEKPGILAHSKSAGVQIVREK